MGSSSPLKYDINIRLGSSPFPLTICSCSAGLPRQALLSRKRAVLYAVWLDARPPPRPLGNPREIPWKVPQPSPSLSAAITLTKYCHKLSALNPRQRRGRAGQGHCAKQTVQLFAQLIIHFSVSFRANIGGEVTDTMTQEEAEEEEDVGLSSIDAKNALCRDPENHSGDSHLASHVWPFAKMSTKSCLPAALLFCKIFLYCFIAALLLCVFVLLIWLPIRETALREASRA